ncbi:MAG: TonB-dependent receptor [Kofleriaceae bacterium]|nr:TonB-dependent receptor [Kofleriaceae bacterium]
MFRPSSPVLSVAVLAIAGSATTASAQAPGDDQLVEKLTEKELTDDDLAKLAAGEAIEIFDERPDKPFDRDTIVRLTGAELAARGAVDLGTALQLLPDVTVRDAGRGGFNLDIRGARKGAVAVLIDGVLVSDPYYGTFDVSTIPITDIVQIRVSTTPQSPIDGPNGPGGVIEVLTRDAIGEQVVIGRLTGDSLPTFGATATMRTPLAKNLALRMSGSGLAGARDLELPAGMSVGEGRRAATGAGRLEYRKGDRRLAIDGFVDDRSYLAPPSDTQRSTILLIDRELSARTSIKLDEKIGKLQLQGQYWIHYLSRRSRSYVDTALTTLIQREHLFAIRSGGQLLATRPFKRDFRWVASATVERDKALVFDINNDYARGAVTMLEVASGLQYERGKLRADGSVGLAAPFGVGATPWPEAKLVGKYKATPTTELTATTGYKGRVPSLRERFDLETGNPAIGPEKAFHGELRVIEQRPRLRLEVAPYYRRTNGTVRVSPDPSDMGRVINLGDMDVYGLDTQGKVVVHKALELGGSYNYIQAKTAESDEPLDRLPHHRLDAWARLFPGKVVTGVVRARYFGTSLDKGFEVGNYTLVEANVTAQVSKDYLAVLRVDDALDVRPETRMGYHSAGRVISLILQGTWQ